jgi:5-formyltetrahydrofolate cyclo-ligase
VEEEKIMMDRVEAKRTLREWMIKERQSVSESKRKSHSRSIARRVTTSPLFREAKTVAVFLGFGSEVQTDAIVEAAWRKKKTVLIPMTDYGLQKTYFAVFRRGDRLYRTNRGPLELSQSKSPFSKRTIDLILVPGLAFDREGNRLGYGGGVYDRLLEKTPRAQHVGLYFSNQELKRIPRDKHDQPLNAAITEKEFVKFPT